MVTDKTLAERARAVADHAEPLKKQGLRAFASTGPMIDLLRECADEIERIRKECDEAQIIAAKALVRNQKLLDTVELIAIRKWPNGALVDFALNAIGKTKADLQALEEKHK